MALSHESRRNSSVWLGIGLSRSCFWWCAVVVIRLKSPAASNSRSEKANDCGEWPKRIFVAGVLQCMASMDCPREQLHGLSKSARLKSSILNYGPAHLLCWCAHNSTPCSMLLNFSSNYGPDHALFWKRSSTAGSGRKGYEQDTSSLDRQQMALCATAPRVPRRSPIQLLK